MDIQHDPTAGRFTQVTDGAESELVYRQADGVMTILHTGVPAQLGGRGIAAELVKTAFETARAQGWKVVPACSYAALFVSRHPDYADLIAQG